MMSERRTETCNLKQGRRLKAAAGTRKRKVEGHGLVEIIVALILNDEESRIPQPRVQPLKYLDRKANKPSSKGKQWLNEGSPRLGFATHWVHRAEEHVGF